MLAGGGLILIALSIGPTPENPAGFPIILGLGVLMIVGGWRWQNPPARADGVCRYCGGSGRGPSPGGGCSFCNGTGREDRG